MIGFLASIMEKGEMVDFPAKSHLNNHLTTRLFIKVEKVIQSKWLISRGKFKKCIRWLFRVCLLGHVVGHKIDWPNHNQGHIARMPAAAGGSGATEIVSVVAAAISSLNAAFFTTASFSSKLISSSKSTFFSSSAAAAT